jgi:RNA polymerase sigma-70 factor (ECF subfamily)
VDLVVLRSEAKQTPAASGARAPADARVRALLDAHFDFVWRSLRRLGLSADQADDGAQQVFLVLSKRIDSIAVGSEPSFLFHTATRVASDVRRSASYRREIAHPDPAVERGGGPRPDELLDERQARALLDSILEVLDVELRTVFVLFEIEEMTIAEIAAMLAIPPGTVASRLRRARERFHAKLARVRAQQGGMP